LMTAFWQVFIIVIGYIETSELIGDSAVGRLV